MNKLFIQGLVKKIAENSYEVLASTSAIDRQGDSIDQSGWVIGNYLKNPVMLWAHDYSELPVAKATSVEVTSKGLQVKFEFAPAEANPKAAQIKMLYDEGFLNAVSVGFMCLEQNGNLITRAELLEVSFVPVPANQEALRLAVTSKGLDISLVEKDFEKGAVENVLNEQEVMEQKYSMLDEVFEVVYAFANVFCDPATSVNDFASLLTETISLLGEVAGTNGADDDTKELGKIADKNVRAEQAKAYRAILLAKAGRELSNKNIEKLKGAMTHIMNGHSVLEEMAKATDSSTDGDGKTIVSEVEKTVILTAKEFAVLVKGNAIAQDKQNEVVLGLVKKFLAQKE